LRSHRRAGHERRHQHEAGGEEQAALVDDPAHRAQRADVQQQEQSELAHRQRRLPYRWQLPGAYPPFPM
jgi:hypothetical protein